MLHKHSIHPTDTFKGLLRSQIIRFVLEYIITRMTLIRLGAFFYKPCVKEITLKGGCVVLKAKLLGNCKQNNVGQIPLFLPAVEV